MSDTHNADFERRYQEGTQLWSGDEAIDRAAGEAVARWEARTGCKADFSVVQGYCLAINERCVELQAENDRLRAALVAAGVRPELVEAIAHNDGKGVVY